MDNSVLHKLLNDLKLSDFVFFNKENRFVNTLNIDVNLHFETQKKLELIKPDAIYVFNNQPFILFFDLTESPKEREDDVHKKVWSFDNSPVIFVIKDKDIYVYNALNYIKKENRLEEIKISEEKRNEQFSFWNLQSGDTWKWFQNQYIEIYKNSHYKKRVNEKLFKNIKEVRKKLIELKLTEYDANSLILRLIFVRYLIDRKVEINNDYILGDVEAIDNRRRSFCELITQPERLNQLFVDLNNRFNGVLFKELDIVINQKQAKFLSDVFNGELQEKDSLFEGYFFEIFDFSIIPVELISGIYESLLDEETRKLDSAVYTPSFLVDYILDKTVEEYLDNNQTSDCKVFEMAVGSGIFLVQSLRRMIEKEIKLNGNANKNAFSEKIREIAKKNLFGIDINESALKVTCFSIYIALLDYQEPKDIKVYKFPKLIDSNLFKANFFDTEHTYNDKIKQEKPLFILGNPPWKKDKSTEHIEWLNKENIYEKKVKGEMEIAQSFLLRTKDFMLSDTQAALIVTSTMFYNVSSTTKTFKEKFLTNYCVDNFFDLSPVRRWIFEEKDSPASIVYFRLPKEKDEHLTNIVNHQSVKINRFLKYFKMLVIEKFDQKEIQQKHFIDNDWLFKVALYGNVLDFVFLQKINENGIKLLSYLKKYSKGAGILSGNKNKYKLYQEIVEKDLIKNGQVSRFYSHINNPVKVKENDAFLKSGKIKNLYQGHQILIKEQTKDESHLVISLTNEPYVFKKGVFGISSGDEKSIKNIYATLISDLYSYYMFYNAGSWATSTRPQIRWKEEYLSFPIIEPNEKTKTELINLVNQFLKPFEEYYKQETPMGEPQEDKNILAKINNVINDLYGITGYEKDLIDYVLNVSRYQFQESKQQKFTRQVDSDKKFLEKYADVFVQEFGKIYVNEFMQVEIYPLNHFIAMNFKFLDTKPEQQFIYSKNADETKVFDFFANKLSISQETNTEDPTKNLFIQKDIKGFKANSFYIIKPNEYKCWHRAMAWYDVAEFTENIEDAELERLTQIEE